jgi:hypothetical protein
MKILEKNLTIIESQRAEQKWMNIYKENGWNLLNKMKGGGIGAVKSSLKYTKEIIMEEAKKYKNMEEMYKKNRSCYNNMMKLNIKHICFPNSKFIKNMAKPYDYTEEFISNITKKYKKKSDLRKYEYRVYHWLYKHNRLYEFYEKNNKNN